MKVILDGVFNHCGSFNKWLDRERIYEKQEGYAPGAYVRQTARITAFRFFQEERERYHTIVHMTDGGDMIHCRS